MGLLSDWSVSSVGRTGMEDPLSYFLSSTEHVFLQQLSIVFSSVNVNVNANAQKRVKYHYIEFKE